MTRNEIRLAAAKKRLDRANAAFNGICKQANDAVRKVRDKYAPRERAASNALQTALAEVTRIELLSHGITPMHTIFRWRGAHYAVKVKRGGQAEMIHVTAKNREHLGKNAKPTPHRWSQVTITDRVLVVGD